MVKACNKRKNHRCQAKRLDTFFFFVYDAIGVKEKVNAMEKIVEQNLLFDFYGELLTDHQKSVYQDAVFNDMSLSEVADCYGISRQGAFDLLKRCDRIMQGYETKLHLIERFSNAKNRLHEIQQLLEDTSSLSENKQKVSELIAEIIEEL
mgnify:CR=1 FL=1